MFEYHGWARIQDSLELFDGAADSLSHQAFETVQSAVALIQEDGLQTADLRVANGSAHLWLAGLRNHRQDPVVDVYRRVAEAAPWSYGTLHVLDDEAPGDAGNRWTVWVMKRGTVTPHADLFLSPHIGEVEDDLGY